MSVFRLRSIFIISLVILGVLVVLAVFRPLATGQEYSTVARESVLQTEDQWIIEFDIINRENKDVNYNIVWSSGGETYTESVLVGKGRIYSHIHHVYRQTIKEDKINMAIYEEGKTVPYERVTYYLK